MNLVDRIISFSDSFKSKTISDVLDDCIETSKNLDCSINTNWFIELKLKIEEELKKYAWEHYASVNSILRNNWIEKTDSGLKIKFCEITILEIYFPSKFNPNSVILKSSFY